MGSKGQQAGNSLTTFGQCHPDRHPNSERRGVKFTMAAEQGLKAPLRAAGERIWGDRGSAKQARTPPYSTQACYKPHDLRQIFSNCELMRQRSKGLGHCGAIAL